MKRAVRERLQRILNSSTSETDSSSPDHAFSSRLRAFNSPRIKHFDIYKEDLYDGSSSASSFEASSRSHDEQSVLVRERRDGYLERMVSNILTDSSCSSEEEGGSIDGGDTYIPQWLRQRTNSASKDVEEERSYKDVKNTTSSRLLSVSEELQNLSKKLKNGAGSDHIASSTISASKKRKLKRKNCTTIHDCKKRLEYLISQLEGLDTEARPLLDSSIDNEVVLAETKTDKTADTAAFGSLLRTEVVASNISENKDTLSGETALDTVDFRQEITYQQSPYPEAVVESVSRPHFPAVDVQGIPHEPKNGKSVEVKSRSKSRSRTRRRKSKSSSKRRTFKGMVETKVLPRVRVARALAEIPKAKLTKPIILARKTISSDAQSIVNIDKDECIMPLTSTPNKTTEETTTSKREPKDKARTSPDIVKSVNSNPDVTSKEVENKGNRKEGNNPNEPIRLEKDVDPAALKTHRQRKPTNDDVEIHSTNRPVTRQTRTTSFRTPSMEKSSTKSQSGTNKSTKKQTQSKRTPSRNNSTARSRHKAEEPQCLDLLLSDNDLQDSEPRSEASTSLKPSSGKSSKPSLSHEETTSKEPDLSEEGPKKSPKRLSSLLRIALRRNDSMDTGDMFRKRNSIGKGRTTRLKESRFGETWRKTKNAFDSMWEKNNNQAHTASGLLSFFRTPNGTKPQRPWRFTV